MATVADDPIKQPAAAVKRLPQPAKGRALLAWYPAATLHKLAAVWAHHPDYPLIHGGKGRAHA